MPERVRNWVFTLNNYTQDDVEHLRRLFSGFGVTDDGEIGHVARGYVCFQPERGANGTPHLQGCVCFDNPRLLNGVKRALGERYHVEPMRGTVDQAVAYCSKEDTRDADAGFSFEEYGTRPRSGSGAGRGTRSDLGDVAALIKSGKRMREVAEAHSSDFIKYHKGFVALQSTLQRKRDFKTKVYWYYGPTGSGKSRAAYEEAGEDVYTKMGENKWWDGYEQQKCVIIDDYRPSLCSWAELLKLFDRYEHRVEVKGCSVHFASEVIYVTTPLSPQLTWADTKEDINQLLRRIDVVRRFGEDEGLFLAN